MVWRQSPENNEVEVSGYQKGGLGLHTLHHKFDGKLTHFPIGLDVAKCDFFSPIQNTSPFSMPLSPKLTPQGEKADGKNLH